MKRSPVLASLLLAACLGCEPAADSTVQGTVTIEGELAKRGTVVFHPVEGGAPAYGTIFQNGTYSLRIGQGDIDKVDGGEVPPGDYIVTVVVNAPATSKETEKGGPPMPGARLTAEKYANKETSDLRVSVTRGVNVVPLELDRAEPEEEGETEEIDSAAESADDDSDAPEATEPETEQPHDESTDSPAEESSDETDQAASDPSDNAAAAAAPQSESAASSEETEP